MPLETKYETDFYRIEVDLEAGLLKAKWLRPVSGKEMEAGGTKLYEILCQTKVERALVDGQALGALPPEAKEWMATRFYDLLSRTQLRWLARILPGNVYHRIALESVVTRAEALGLVKFLVANFAGQGEALWWLELWSLAREK